MSRVTINGVTYTGKSVSVSRGKVIIDGVNVTPDSNRNIEILVEGNIEMLTVDSCDKIRVSGSVGSISTQSGDVDISGDISGSVSTMSGDVMCGEIFGSVSTMSGDIKNKRKQ